MSNQSFSQKRLAGRGCAAYRCASGDVETVDDLTLSPLARTYLHTRHPEGIYRHQKAALQWPFRASHVPVYGHGLGKSLVFQ
jgi:hypothetical protein